MCEFVCSDYSRMEESTALFILHKIAHNFISVMTEQTKTLPDADGKVVAPEFFILPSFLGISGRRDVP